jgi:hypothetical protein
MKSDQPLMIVLATLALASCSTVSVRTEHDPRTNFAKYRTYAWAARPKHGIQPSPGVRAQIESSLDQGLAGKGYIKSANPDFYIVYHITKSEQVQVSQYTDWGYTGRGYHAGYSYRQGSGYYSLWPNYPISYAQVTRYTEGTLIVDFIDAKTATSIWRGTATGTIGSAQSNQQKIAEAIRKMLESIPAHT